MKSLQRRFLKITQKNPYWSSYCLFAKAVTGQKLKKKIINYWFNRLVEKHDYPKADKKTILNHLYNLTLQ